MTGDESVGGCQCAQVRYELANRHGKVYACHCQECQKQSASAFGLTMPVRAADLAITGKLACYERPTDSGSLTRCYFCPDCGTRMFHQDSSAGEMISLKAGSLDDTSGLTLIAHLWVARKQPWIALDPDLPVFDTQPDDLGAWRRGLV